MSMSQAAAHQSMDAAATWLADAAQQRSWDAAPLHDALRGFLTRQVEALQQISGGGAAVDADTLPALLRSLCGIAAVADLLRRHGLSSLLEPTPQQVSSPGGRQGSATPAWLAPWLEVAAAAATAAARCRGEAAPELAALIAAAKEPLLQLQVWI